MNQSRLFGSVDWMIQSPSLSFATSFIRLVQLLPLELLDPNNALLSPFRIAKALKMPLQASRVH
jgi:hypothetical protein